MIFEVECDEERTNERTYGLDAHTYCLFYSIRYYSSPVQQQMVMLEKVTPSAMKSACWKQPPPRPPHTSLPTRPGTGISVEQL